MGTISLWVYFIFLWITQIGCKELRVVCYYTNWSIYRPGSAKFSPQNINPYLCTHLIYAFGGFTKENTFKPFDKYQDIEKGGYAKFTGLKTYNKNLKTLLAIGGWNEGSTRFSPMVASSERRKEFVKNSVKFLRLNHFDGLDLDWEYPSFRDGGKPRDRDNYAQLVQELREEFERESEKTGRTRLLLTMAVPAGIEYINKGYDVPKLMKYLDWMNILSYDYHSAFEPSVNHHAPLYPLEEESEYNYDTELNIDHTIKHYLEAGAISEKLVLGIPTYGRSYTLFNPDAYEIGAPADGPGEMGDATRENGYLAYYEICESVKSGDWTVVQPNEDAMGPYAYKDNQWVGYDDENIARKKAQYVAEKGLGGIMFWAIDNDDFRGTCHNKPYPIIEAAKESLVEALGLNEENAISKSAKSNKSRTRSRGKETQKARVQNSGGRQSDIQKSTRRRIVKNREQVTEKTTVPQSRRRRPTSSQEPNIAEHGSSLVITTPSYKTPEPPTTPDPGGDFKCEDEGFFPHPRDCKKYFWCLSGPSELGIVAHQFTCPAGLYFNKAASSCDYTQNVLCNKKTAKSTTPKPLNEKDDSSSKKISTSTTTTTAVPKRDFSLFSTRRAPPRITAATSKTTFTTTTPEPEYEDEYEYTNDEVDENTDSEDPMVIKELLELIKKAGGIDELEKQLNFKSESTVENTNNQATPSSISKKLYEKVLARTKLGDSTTKKSTSRYNTLNRNSRGPQNEGLVSDTSVTKENDRSRPKYSTITRQRASKLSDTENVKEETIEKEKEEEKKNNKEYITIRRKPSNPVNKENENIDEEEEEETSSKLERSTTTKSPYVTLRRFRPSTLANDEEDKEVENDASELLNRQVLGEDERDNEPISSSPNYIQIQRQRSSTTEATTSKYKQIVRSTTAETTNADDVTTESSALSDSNSLTNFSASGTNTLKPTKEEPTNTTVEDSLNIEIKPQLLEPRPFSLNFNVRSTTLKPSVESSKVSLKPQLRSRIVEAPSLQFDVNNNRNRFRGVKTETTTKTHEEVERHFRPDISAEISDFSSLTAVDFSSLREFSGTTRKHRPRIVSTTEKYNNTKIAGRRRQNVQPKEDNEINTRKVIRRIRPINATNSSNEKNNRNVYTRRIIKPLLFTKSEKQEDILNNSAEELDEEDEGENIKLSESNILENSDVNRINSNSLSYKNEKDNKRVIKRIRIFGKEENKLAGNKDDHFESPLQVKVTTEPNIVVRTRKIVRKLSTTSEAPYTILSTTESNDSITNRRRKVIRRLKTGVNDASNGVDFDQNEQKESEVKEIQPNKLNSRIRGGRIVLTTVPTTKSTSIRTTTQESSFKETTTYNDNASTKVEPKTLQEIERLATTSSPNLLKDDLTNKPINEVIDLEVTENTVLNFQTTTEADTLTTTESLNDFLINSTELIIENKSVDDYNSSDNLSNVITTDPVVDYVTTEALDFQEITSTTTTTTAKPYINKIYKNIESRPKLDLKARTISTKSAIETANIVRQFKTRPSRFRSTTEENIVDEDQEIPKTSKNGFKLIDEETTNKPIRRTSARTEASIELDEIKSTKKSFRPTSYRFVPKINNNDFSNKPKIGYKRVSTTSPATTAVSHNVEAINARNKQLYSKPRKMNIPHYESQSEQTSTMEQTTFTNEITTDITNRITTEKPTTFYHVFAETEETATSTTMSVPDHDNKLEKLIEVNRIVEINGNNSKQNDNNPVLDHIGVINRVTVIKVVEGDNGTEYISDDTKKSSREERKFEIYGDSKVADYTQNTPDIVNAKQIELVPNQIIIESKSAVKTITPRPLFSNEVSTIALEGLFRTDAPTKFDTTEELLETEQSKYVNVKVLGNNYNQNYIHKILPEEDGGLKAQVVEISRPRSSELIKIAPIEVAFGKRSSG